MQRIRRSDTVPFFLRADFAEQCQGGAAREDAASMAALMSQSLALSPLGRRQEMLYLYWFQVPPGHESAAFIGANSRGERLFSVYSREGYFVGAPRLLLERVREQLNGPQILRAVLPEPDSRRSPSAPGVLVVHQVGLGLAALRPFFPTMRRVHADNSGWIAEELAFFDLFDRCDCTPPTRRSRARPLSFT